MPSSKEQVGLQLRAAGQLDRLAQAVEKGDSMDVVDILQAVGVDDEIIARMLIQFDKDYLLEVIEAGRSAEG